MKQAQLNEKDHQFAKEYLERKLTLSPNWLSESIDTQFEAEKSFKSEKCDKVTLSNWCRKWLNEEQKTQLKNAIRAKRSREARKSGPGTKSVTLSHEAWLILSDCAKRDRVTLSQWIIQNLENKKEPVTSSATPWPH